MRETLAISQLFSGLDDGALERVASAAGMKHTTRGEMLFYEGDVAEAFFIVGEGKVKVFKMSPDGKEQILMIAEAGDSVAEAALFADRRYPASAQVLEDGQLVVINRERFVGLLGKHPELAVNLIGRLSHLLRNLTKLVEGLSLADVTTRVAHYLSTHMPDNNGEPCTITLTEKKATLASQLGTIPETLSRSFARLTKQKVIKIDGSNITILDPDRLQEIAAGG
jgi:CRP/FNR family transcriptional regulator